jgi:hypothetical protein
VTMELNAPPVMIRDHQAASTSAHSSSSPPAAQSYTSISDSNSDSYNTTSNTYYNKFTTAVSDEDRELLSWLSPLQPWQRHQDIRSNRLDGTGEWLLQMDKFQAWRDGDVNGTFCCYGGPGVGKTFIRYSKSHTSMRVGPLADCMVLQFSRYRLLV